MIQACGIHFILSLLDFIIKIDMSQSIFGGIKLLCGAVIATIAVDELSTDSNTESYCFRTTKAQAEDHVQNYE